MAEYKSTFIGDMLQRIKSVDSADEFWRCQLHLRERLLCLEVLVKKRRRQLRYFKKAKHLHTRSPRKGLIRIQQFDELIDQIASSESELLNSIGAAKYLGDTIAFSMLPAHIIKILSYNEQAGSMLGKSGSDHEFEIARQLHEMGLSVFVNDLSHSIRIGDLIVYSPDGIYLIECKKSHIEKRLFRQDRLDRQVERMELANHVLRKEDWPIREALQADSHSKPFPSAFIESKEELRFLTEALIAACQLENSSFVVIDPEAGLKYVGVRKGTNHKEWITTLQPEVVNKRVSVGVLQSRMQGTAHFVDPVTLLAIPNELLTDLLLGEILFCVIIDLDYVLNHLKDRGLDVSFNHDNNDGFISITAKVDAQDAFFEVGGGLLMKVLYGAASLESAMDQMIDSYHQFVSAIGDLPNTIGTDA